MHGIRPIVVLVLIFYSTIHCQERNRYKEVARTSPASTYVAKLLPGQSPCPTPKTNCSCGMCSACTTCSACPNVPKGATGPRGPAGQAGAKGPCCTGATGPIGPAGAVGDTGEPGKGLSCLDGLTTLTGGITEEFPNTYFLCENTIADIRISESNVVFDLHGYALTGSIILDNGVDNVMIKNGSIVGAQYGVGSGIDAPASTNCQFLDLVITGFGTGIYLHGVGFKGASNTNRISRCTCDENENYGIRLVSSHENAIESCVCRLDTIGIGLTGCYGNSIIGCTCEAATPHAIDAIGLLLDLSDYNRVYSCTCSAAAGAAGATAYGIKVPVSGCGMSDDVNQRPCVVPTYRTPSYYIPERRVLIGSNNTIISCVVTAIAPSGDALATGIDLSDTETSVLSCRVHAVSETNDAIGIKLCGARNTVTGCTVTAETKNASSVGLEGSSAISIVADSQSITACFLKAVAHKPMISSAIRMASIGNNVQACTLVGTELDSYGILFHECLVEQNIVANNILRNCIQSEE